VAEVILMRGNQYTDAVVAGQAAYGSCRTRRCPAAALLAKREAGHPLFAGAFRPEPFGHGAAIIGTGLRGVSLSCRVRFGRPEPAGWRVSRRGYLQAVKPLRLRGFLSSRSFCDANCH
jgi:hypothetical protein